MYYKSSGKYNLPNIPMSKILISSFITLIAFGPIEKSAVIIFVLTECLSSVKKYN
jgi:hypothetical protein